jgi:hypothetical protein
MVGMTFSSSGFQRFGVGADILSGTSTTATTETNTFVPAFHTGHKFYGFMDYFVGIPGQGLHDYIVTARYKVRDGLSINATGHLFQLAQSAAPGKDLGTEFDIVTSWQYNSFTTLQAGASLFQPGDVMKALYGGSDIGVWGFVLVQVSM